VAAHSAATRLIRAIRLPDATRVLAGIAGLLVAFGAGPTDAIETDPFWGVICASHLVTPVSLAAFSRARPGSVAACGPAPAVFQELPSVGGGGAASVALNVGYDASTSRLCYVNATLAEAPVIRVGAGHALTFNLTNTLHNSGVQNALNCPIATFGGEGACAPAPQFRAAPGVDGGYYPIEANQAHTADGTTNLHTHGLFVSPQPCSDEVLLSTLYPANWVLPVTAPQPCQTAPNQLTYTYNLPPDHPAGLYWYHTHRHGTAETQTQMGLVGAIIVEDGGDAHRAAIGVTDEVLVVTDTPRACADECSDAVQPRSDKPAARAAARQAEARAMPDAAPTTGHTLDPRIDEVDQAGGCAAGATDDSGGFQLWSLKLNGAPVAENVGGAWPPDTAVLSKTMRPGQRQIFRLVNAAADSFVAPQIALLRNNVLTVQPLEVLARDGVGLADASGKRRIGFFDVAKSPLIVPPSGRIEFVVHAPPAGTTLYLQTSQVNPGCGGNRYPSRRLLRLTSAGAPVDPGAADDSDLLVGAAALPSYIPAMNSPASVSRTFVFSEYSRGFTYALTRWLSGPPNQGDYNAGLVDFYITQVAVNGVPVNQATTALVPFMGQTLAPQVVVHLHGKQSVTEQWLVENATLEIHAFHMHQVHFRDITAASSDPDQQPVLDVVTVPAARRIGDIASGYPGAPGWVRLLMTFTKADIGEFVFHCHILEHEDSGMMAKIQVVAD
jgi:FtsP/CotA-like multicopper oxidase with cupredoxin domain